MVNEMQRLASRRFGGASTQPQNPSAQSEPLIEGAGLMMQKLGGGAGPQAVSQPSAPQPGVSGVTPGAVERRLGAMPTQQAGGLAQGPTQQAQFSPPQRAQHLPDQAGPARKALSAPVGNIENFLRNLQTRNNRE